MAQQFLDQSLEISTPIVDQQSPPSESATPPLSRSSSASHLNAAAPPLFRSSSASHLNAAAPPLFRSSSASHLNAAAPPLFRSSSASHLNAAAPPLFRSSSASRLNAAAPEFVPRAPPAGIQQHVFHSTPPISHLLAPSPPPISHLVAPSPPASHGVFEYFGGGFGEQEPMLPLAEPDPSPVMRECLLEELTWKIVKQVEYYFSDVNLATTEHLMRFISKDPEGSVPMPVIASFKKIKALVSNNSLLADALRTSSRLVVSDDGKKVCRRHPFTDSDVEELQSRIIVAENLPDDHCYQNLMKIFSSVGRVKTIRTCYPQTPNGTVAATNWSTKMDMLFGSKVHAFVEYESVDDAERAVAELNEEGNWRSGLRVRCLYRCLYSPSSIQIRHAPGRARKSGCEGDGNGEDASATNHPNLKKAEDPSHSFEALKLTGQGQGNDGLNDRDGGSGARQGRGRGRGGRGRGWVPFQNGGQRNGGYLVGTPPSSYPMNNEVSAVSKQPPGPRMPDGTRGFTMGRGKLIAG